MAQSSLNDHVSDQKVSSLELRDKLYDELQQAAALATVAHSQHFLVFEKVVQRNYLWALENLMAIALK
jgi:hypothetical protein